MSDSIRLASIHQPTIIAPTARGVGSGWLIMIAVAIVYGSLIPFELDLSVFTPAAGFGLLRLGMHAAGPGDIVTNLVLYIPLGFAFILCSHRRAGRLPASRVVLAVVSGTALSLVVEVVQTGMPSRVASWLDVLLNGSGTAIGALAGVRLMSICASGATSLKERLANSESRTANGEGPTGRSSFAIRHSAFAIHSPFAFASSALTLGLLVYYLLPLDFITDTSSLHDSFLRARWDLGVAQPTSAGWLAGHSGGPLCHIVVAQRLIGALWFSVLGYCLVLSRREAGQRRMAAVGSAIEHGWALAVVAHLMTLFVASRVFDVVALCQSLPAVLLGALCALFTMGTRDRAPWTGRGSVTAPTLLLCTLAVLQVLAMVLRSTGTQTWVADIAGPQRSLALPFEAMWHLPIRLAASTALSHCVTYGALAGTLALMLQRARVRAPWLASGALAAAIALALHTAAHPATAGGVDFTVPILAGASALVLAALHRISAGFPLEVADRPLIW